MFKGRLRICIALLLCVIITAVSVICAFSAEYDNTEAVIYFTCDNHGFSEQLTYVKTLKEKTDNALLVNCGNFTKGSIESSLSNGKYSSMLMKEAGYDIVSVGNDDFTYGYRAFLRIKDYIGADVLSANVKYDDSLIAEQNVIKTVNGVKFGFFGITSAGAYSHIPTARREGYSFDDEIKTANAQIAALNGRCDYIICMANFTPWENSVDYKSFAEALSGVDALICSGTGGEIQEKIGDTLVVSAGEDLQSVGRISVADGMLKYNLLPEYLYDENGKSKEETKGTYREYGIDLAYQDVRKELSEQFDKTVSDAFSATKSVLYSGLEDFRSSLVEETPMGDIAADAIELSCEKVKAGNDKYKDYITAAFLNGTVLVSNINAGDIALRETFYVFSQANNLYYYETDGAFLYKILEKSVAQAKFSPKTGFVSGESDLFLQISGINIEIDTSKKPGKRIVSMYYTDINGDIQPIKNNGSSKILLAVNEELADGSAGYDDFLSLQPAYTGDMLSNALRTYIAANTSEGYFSSFGTDGRIKYTKTSELEPNGNAWITVDKKYESYVDTDILLDTIDNIDCLQADKNGEVRICVNLGAHGVSVNGDDTYVSTVTGVGIKKDSITPVVYYGLYYDTLNKAYDINEEEYDERAVEGYKQYLSLAYVETQLTEEDKVVSATQDVLDIIDKFEENPNQFIKDEDEDESEEDSYYFNELSIDDFDVDIDFRSNVFTNQPHTSTSVKSNASQTEKNTSENSSDTGDNYYRLLLIVSIVFIVGAVCIASSVVIDIKKLKCISRK